MLNTVKVPKQFELLFEKAQENVGKYFSDIKKDPSKGTIEIFGERYVLIRAASMSVDFFETISKLYQDQGENKAFDIARQFLFDMAHAIGKQDAKKFSEKLNLKDPVEKLSAGPVHFSYTGWAFVDIFPESKPSPDENYYLIYDHPYSFESDSWKNVSKKSDFPVCIMNAGYSSGWCEESFGITLVAVEIMCKAKGDECCRFIMAPPSKIEEHIKEYLKKEPKLARSIVNYEIPGFFKRKQIEDELRFYGEMIKNISEAVYLIKMSDGLIVYANPKFEKMFGYELGEIIGKHVSVVNAPTDKKPEETANEIMNIIAKTGEWHGEVKNIKKDKTLFWCYANISIFDHSTYGKVLVSVHTDITERKKIQDDLEKINKLMVDRELKMSELKQEIIELKKKLKII